VSVATGTIDPTIVDGLTALPDKPAAAPSGASGQWQMLQPARLRRTPSEAQKSVGASNDPWIGDLGLPRSSSLTGSGGLCPADSPAKLTCATLRSSISKSKLSSIGLAHSWPPHAGSNGNRTPVSLPRAWRNGAGTNPPPSAGCAGAGRAVGQAVSSKDPRPPLPPGRRGSAALVSTQRLSTGVSSRQAITAPGGREHIEHERRS
jgi:hypothetical protein